MGSCVAVYTSQPTVWPPIISVVGIAATSFSAGIWLMLWVNARSRRTPPDEGSHG